MLMIFHYVFFHVFLLILRKNMLFNVFYLLLNVLNIYGPQAVGSHDADLGVGGFGVLLHEKRSVDIRRLAAAGRRLRRRPG